MKSINEAAKAANAYGYPNYTGANNEAFDSGFKSGVKFAQQWIPVEVELPEKGVEVLVKAEKLSWITTNHTIAYLKENTMDNVWIIESRHCSHYKNAVNNCVTHWRPIEQS